MGVQITGLLAREEIPIDSLKHKVIAIDSSLFLYQFLTSIRSRDGSLLTDSHGNVTSHLVGLFSRTAKLMQQGLRLVYVFDGTPPILKQKERDKRREQKIIAENKYKEAAKKEDYAEMKKYAARTTRLTSDMIEEAKKLIEALGLPMIEAPSEGEAQAAHLVKKGDAFGVASQDADCLLFGSPVLIRNLSLTGKRKINQKLSFEVLKPEKIDLHKTLAALGISHKQLIALGMLVGTDFNPGGIKGIGPKNALKLVKQYPNDNDTLFKEVGWNNYFDYSWKEVYDIISNMPITDSYSLSWNPIDEEKIKKLLVDMHDFAEERVMQSIGSLKETRDKLSQKGLTDFFK
jgi:flap endonuclease-1